MTTRRPMIMRLGLLAALAVVGVLVVVVVTTPHDKSSPSGGGTGVASELDGIPQSGLSLGSPDAPVTLVEFADLQCPFCAEYDQGVLPELLDRYVKTGKVRLELHLLRFLGPDSDRLARVAAAASAQDRMWQFTALAFARQGTENSGYATAAFIDKLAADAGLKNPDAGPAAERLVRRSEQAARTLGIDSTPSFLIGPSDGTLERFQPSDLTPGAFEPRIERELSG
jgi:protein-disulfide isomerase